MLLGFALTEHCNLRCPHCIRDDVTTVRSLDAALVESVLDQAIALYGSVTARDRKSTRLNSSHDQISYAVFCLKKKTGTQGLRLHECHLASQHAPDRSRASTGSM